MQSELNLCVMMLVCGVDLIGVLCGVDQIGVLCYFLTTVHFDNIIQSFVVFFIRCHQQLQGLEPGEGEDDKEFDGGFVVPGKLWSRLYR